MENKIDNSDVIALAAEITEYIVYELVYGGPIKIQEENGDERYTDEAQEVFNDHYGEIKDIIKKLNLRWELRGLRLSEPEKPEQESIQDLLNKITLENYLAVDLLTKE